MMYAETHTYHSLLIIHSSHVSQDSWKSGTAPIVSFGLCCSPVSRTSWRTLRTARRCVVVHGSSAFCEALRSDDNLIIISLLFSILCWSPTRFGRSFLREISPTKSLSSRPTPSDLHLRPTHLIPLSMKKAVWVRSNCRPIVSIILKSDRRRKKPWHRPLPACVKRSKPVVQTNISGKPSSQA